MKRCPAKAAPLKTRWKLICSLPNQPRLLRLVLPTLQTPDNQGSGGMRTELFLMIHLIALFPVTQTATSTILRKGKRTRTGSSGDTIELRAKRTPGFSHLSQRGQRSMGFRIVRRFSSTQVGCVGSLLHPRTLRGAIHLCCTTQFEILIAFSENDGMSQNDRIADTSDRGIGFIARCTGPPE